MLQCSTAAAAARIFNSRAKSETIPRLDRGINYKQRRNTTMKVSSASIIILATSLDVAGAFAPAASSNIRLQPLHSSFSYLENLGDEPAASPGQQQPPQQAFMQPVPDQYAPAAPVGGDPAMTSRGDKFQYSPCTPIGDNTRGGQYGRLSGLAPGRE